MATDSTRALVAAASRALSTLFSTMDTVDWETPAALATSVMVGRRTGVGLEDFLDMACGAGETQV